MHFLNEFSMSESPFLLYKAKKDVAPEVNTFTPLEFASSTKEDALFFKGGYIVTSRVIKFDLHASQNELDISCRRMPFVTIRMSASGKQDLVEDKKDSILGCSSGSPPINRIFRIVENSFRNCSMSRACSIGSANRFSAIGQKCPHPLQFRLQ